MATTITKKDIFVTIGILLIAFVGLPLLLFGISRVRLMAFRSNLMPVLRPIMEKYANSAENLPDIAKEEGFLDKYLTDQKFNEWTRWDNPNTKKAKLVDKYPRTHEQIRLICIWLQDELERNKEIEAYIASYGTTCGFWFFNGSKPIGADDNSYAAFDLDEKNQKILESLKQMKEKYPWNIHLHERALHVIILLKQNPDFVWEMMIAPEAGY